MSGAHLLRRRRLGTHRHPGRWVVLVPLYAALAALLATLTFLAFGCRVEEAAPAVGPTLTLRLPADPPTLDPAGAGR